MKALAIGVTLAASLVGTDVQELSREDIAAAIEQGRSGKTLQKRCSARGDNGIDIVAEGPIGRIMRSAREAKRKNQDFTVADVTTAMTDGRLRVTAARTPLYKPVSEYVTPGIPGGFKYETSFVIRSKPSKSEQAIVLAPVAISYNADGTSNRRVVVSGPLPANLPPLPGSNMEASFDFAAFRSIPHKDVEVVVFMTDTGEHKCKISEGERKALR